MRAGNEIRVGIVVIAALVFMAVGYFFLRGLGLGADLYYVQLDEAATISEGNDVRLQGVKIGQVKTVELDPVTQKPVLTLAIRRSKPPTHLLKAYQYSVRTNGVIGEQYVDIRGKFDPKDAVFAANDRSIYIPGQAVSGLSAAGDQATQLIAGFRTTLGKFNTTLDQINTGVLSRTNQEKLTQALEGVTLLTQRVGQSFGSQGVRLSFGDPRSQQALNDTLGGTAIAAQEAAAAAHNINVLTKNAGRDIQLLTRDMRSVVGENKGQLSRILTSLETTTNNVAGLTKTIDVAMRNSGFKENSQIAFDSLRKAAQNVEATTANFRTITGDPESAASLKATLAALKETTESLRDTTRTIKNAVSDTGTQNQLKGILTTLNTTATTLQATTENLRDTTGGLKNLVADPKLQEDVKGTASEMRATLAAAHAAADGLKGLIADQKLQEDLKGSAAELRGTLAATRTAAERISGLLGGKRKRDKPADGSTPAGQRRGDAGSIDFTYRRFIGVEGAPRVGNDVSGRNYGDLTFNGSLFNSPLRVGVANIGEGTDFTLQSGITLNKAGAVRYGLYRSKLGAGIDYRLGRFSLEGNAWNPNNGSYNAYAGFQVTPKIEILAGREHIRGVRANSLGVRLRP